MFISIIFTALIIYASVYLIGKYNEIYWKRRNVVLCKKNKVLGPVYEVLFRRRAFFEALHDIYKMYPNEPAVGIGSLLRPAIYVIDPKNVQHVLQNDFASFNHRGVDINENDLLGDSVLFMNGVRWKLMRQKMTPLFTASKLKNMYYIIDRSAQDFIDYLELNPDKLKSGTYGSLNLFCCASVLASIFGIGTKSTFESPFLEMALSTQEPGLSNNLAFGVSILSSYLYRILKLKLFGDHEDFFIGAIKQVIRQREKENVKKHDFADICVSLQETGVMKDHETGFELYPTDELLAAQAFFFLIAGVEPCATSIFGSMIELGKHPQVLERCQKEVDDIFDKYQGKLSYDALSEMRYLDNILSETLRMYPPIGFLTRKCVRDTILPVGNIKIAAGTIVYTPIYEYHHDEKYYHDPQSFNPDRFDDVKHNDNEYMPFGKGGRICIGLRYARLQVKAGLVYILRKFNLRTKIGKGGVKFESRPVQVRLMNVDVEMIPR